MRLFSLPSIIVLCLVLGFDYEGSLAKSQITPKLVTLSLKRALPDRDLHPEIVSKLLTLSVLYAMCLTLPSHSATSSRLIVTFVEWPA